VRFHLEHLAHTLKPALLFGREGHCFQVRRTDKIDGFYKRMHTGYFLDTIPTSECGYPNIVGKKGHVCQYFTIGLPRPLAEE